MIRLLTRPSSFVGNPAGHALNQIGHAALGIAFVSFGGPLWLWAAGYLAWEAVQLGFFGASVSDSLEDAGFAIGGALCAVFGWPVAVPLGFFLASGIAARKWGM